MQVKRQGKGGKGVTARWLPKTATTTEHKDEGQQLQEACDSSVVKGKGKGGHKGKGMARGAWKAGRGAERFQLLHPGSTALPSVGSGEPLSTDELVESHRSLAETMMCGVLCSSAAEQLAEDVVMVEMPGRRVARGVGMVFHRLARAAMQHPCTTVEIGAQVEGKNITQVASDCLLPPAAPAWFPASTPGAL